MAAILAAQVREVTGLSAQQTSGSSVKRYAQLDITATTAAVSDTLDLTTVAKVAGIVGPVLETMNAVKCSGASNGTWSGTTVTFVSHSGAGAYRGLWLIEQ